MQNEPSALIIGVAHHLDIRVAVLQSLDRRVLARGRRAHDRELVKLYHLPDDILGTAGITESPARHRVGLRETVDHNGPFLHPVELRYRSMLSAVGQLRVDLIGDNEQILFLYHLGDRSELLTRHDGTCRIVRERKHEDLRPVGAGVPDLIGCKLEIILLEKLYRNRLSARHQHAGLVRNIARLRQQHLIARIEHDSQGNIDRLAASYGHERLIIESVMQIETALEIIADFLTQLDKTCVRGIMSSSSLKRVYALLADMPGRVKIRLAHAERYRVLHFRDNVKELPDARGLYIDNGFI